MAKLVTLEGLMDKIFRKMAELGTLGGLIGLNV